MALDQIGDFLGSGEDLHRLAKLYPFPDFVKQADTGQTFSPPSASPTAYAWVSGAGDQQLYPCHTPAATWLSHLFFLEKRAQLNPKITGRIEQQLAHATRVWGLKRAVDELCARHAELQKNADDRLPDSDFAFVWRGADGDSRRQLRIKNAMEVKAAAQWLNTYRDSLVFRDRHTIARKIWEKAGAYGADLGEHERFIEQQAGRGLCVPSTVISAIRQRAKLAKDSGMRQAILKLAELAEQKKAAAFAPGALVKMAETLEAIDQGLGLIGHYGPPILRPEDLIFAVTYKEGADGVSDSVALTTGNVYSRSSLSKLAVEDLRGLFGDELATEVADGLHLNTEKLATQLRALPRPDAELFERLASEAGIRPSHKQAGDWHRMDKEAQAELAASY